MSISPERNIFNNESDFTRRLEMSEILVIGASYSNNGDMRYWGNLDNNWIGVSHEMSFTPIKHVPEIFGERWNSETFSKIFQKYPHKKFTRIYIDRGTFHHMKHVNVISSLIDAICIYQSECIFLIPSFNISYKGFMEKIIMNHINRSGQIEEADTINLIESKNTYEECLEVLNDKNSILYISRYSSFRYILNKDQYHFKDKFIQDLKNFHQDKELVENKFNIEFENNKNNNSNNSNYGRVFTAFKCKKLDKKLEKKSTSDHIINGGKTLLLKEISTQFTKKKLLNIAKELKINNLNNKSKQQVINEIIRNL